MESIETVRLIDQAKAGDRTALETLLVAHADKLSAHIAGRMPTTLQAVLGVEDILQETFLEAFLKIERLRETTPGAFTAWLKAIADVGLLRAIRTQSRRKRGGQFRRLHGALDSATGSLVDLIDKLPADGSTASRVLARREAIAALQVGIAGLPQQQRWAIQLHLLDGKSLAETAAVLGCTKGAVRAFVHRGKQSLAEVMVRASAWLSRR